MSSLAISTLPLAALAQSPGLLERWGPSLICAGGMVLLWLVYNVFRQPLRRRERVDLLLDIIESGLRDGHKPEQMVVGLARSGDRFLGKQVQRLARLIEQGVPMDEAVAMVPRLLPAQVVAMLRAGSAVGGWQRVLPVCRRFLHDGVDRVFQAQHYLALLALVVIPAWLVAFTFLGVFVFPKIRQIAMDIGASEPSWLRFLTANYSWLLLLQVVCVLVAWGCVILYHGGPRLAQRLRYLAPGLVDRFVWCVPWRRCRMLRDFSALLARLLDAGLPEDRAVYLAAQATANELFIARAGQVKEALARGVPLPSAIELLDVEGELSWRLANAAHGGGAFTAALEGWHLSLEARAYQQEQMVAQLLTTGLVLLNGFFVGILAIGVFQVFTQLIMEGSAW